MKRLPLWICCVILYMAGFSPFPARAENATAESVRNDLISSDPKIHARGLADLKALLTDDPRGAPTGIYRLHIPGYLVERGDFADAADLCLDCINGQPDRVDRLEYFFDIRVKALLALGKNVEALSAAKSYYNVASIKSTPKVIDTVSQCLAAAYPDDPGMARRFTLQQFAGASSLSADEATAALGRPVLAMVKVDSTLYTGRGLSGRNRTGQSIGHANVLLLADHPDEALDMLTALCKSTVEATQVEAKEGVARALKAQSGSVAPANAYFEKWGLVSQQPTSLPSDLALPPK